MVALDEVVNWLDGELGTSSIGDYPGAMNGLQLANTGVIGRIVAAVDASLAVIQAAAEGGPGLLIVHHGMFWQGAQPVTGAFYRKLKIAMEANLAIYSSHLPLDVHPEFGNNILLSKAIHLKDPKVRVEG
jgi:putative NIF3 family GTP cyclohydrolase 1 type 2